MLKVATICTGIGAPEKALTLLKIPFELSFFSEIDTPAVRSYCAIHNESGSKNLGDLSKIDFAKLPKDIDLIVGGTPCQDFSTSGLGKGGEEGSGTRSSLMWYYVKMIKTIRPKVVVWENVAAVLSRNHIRTYGKFYKALCSLGYKVYADLLNAKFFNVPQNRVRIFVVAIREDLGFTFKFPYGYDSGVRIKDILRSDVPDKFFTKDLSAIDLYKIKPFATTHSMIQLGRLKNTNFKQNNEVLSIDGIFDCLTTKQGNYILDDRIPREKPIRRLMANESFRLMGFTDADYRVASENVSDSEIYIQTGNSMAVPVLMAIFGQLYGVPWREKVFKERYKTDEQLLYELPLFSYIKEQEDAAA